MLRTKIERASMPPELQLKVEAANSILERRLNYLEVYDLSAEWMMWFIDDVPHVMLRLTAHHRGREYTAQAVYPVESFSEHNFTKLTRYWEQESEFFSQLSRLNLDDLKEQQARSDAFFAVGVL